MLHYISPQQCVDAVRTAGGVVLESITPAETIAIQVLSNCTDRARIAWGRFLRSKNGGKAVIASEDSVKSFMAKNKSFYPQLQIGNYKYKEKGKTKDDYNEINIKYTYCELMDVVRCNLTASRSNWKGVMGFKSVGVGNETGLGIYITEDHGKEAFRQIAVLLFREGSNLEVVHMGTFEYKENYVILKNTLFKNLEKGIADLQKSIVIFIEWSTAFDFVIINNPFLVDEWDEARADWRKFCADFNYIDGKVTASIRSQTFQFETSIPPLQNCSFRAMKFFVHVGADGQAEFMIYGRHGHSSSKCIHSPGTMNQNFGDSFYDCREFTLQDICEEIEQYNTLNNMECPKDKKSIEYNDYMGLKKKVTKNTKQSGITNLKPLINVDMQYLHSAYLHSFLGMGNEFIEMIINFVREYIEADSDHIAILRKKHEDDKKDKQLKKDFTDACTNRINRPIEKKLEDILADYGIV